VGFESYDEVVDLLFDCAVCQVGVKWLGEVSDAGAGEVCDRAAVGDA
jgi:hypothetical protein